VTRRGNSRSFKKRRGNATRFIGFEIAIRAKDLQPRPGWRPPAEAGLQLSDPERGTHSEQLDILKLDAAATQQSGHLTLWHNRSAPVSFDRLRILPGDRRRQVRKIRIIGR
jgi:hypothetical protein